MCTLMNQDAPDSNNIQQKTETSWHIVTIKSSSLAAAVIACANKERRKRDADDVAHGGCKKGFKLDQVEVAPAGCDIGCTR